MGLKRAAALPLLAFVLAGCHEDPEVVTVFVTPTSTGFSYTAFGGDGFSQGVATGNGGLGGAITLYSSRTINFGGSTLAPSAPTPPAAPATGTPVSSLVAFPPTAGNLLILGSLVTDLVANQTVESTTGDIVVSGSIQSADFGTTQTNLTLRALNGTVYITGVVRTASVDGLLDGDSAGSLTIEATRVVLTGTLDARGEQNTAGAAGNGGAVTLTPVAGADHVYFTAGSIDTSGGQGTLGGGGAGGVVSISAGNQLHVYGSINTFGGLVDTSAVAAVAASDGGNVTLNAGGSVDVVSTITMRGGDITGFNGAGVTAGRGGDFLTNSPVPTRIYCTLTTEGGVALDASGAIAGGVGGNIEFGRPASRLLTAEIGRGLVSTSGGWGGSSGTLAGDVTVHALEGNITVGAAIEARGGNGTGSGPSAAGPGGNVTITADSAVGAESITLQSAGSIDTSGGTGVGTGAASFAGNISITGGLDITVNGLRIAVGGGPGLGAGGSGGNVTLTSDVRGDLSLTGTIDTRGGTSSGAAGGAGGNVLASAAGTPGEIVSSAKIATSGGNGAVAGAGGLSGTIGFSTVNGDIALSGTLTTTGSSSAFTPRPGGAVTVTCGGSGGSITNSAAINASGGSSTAISGTNLGGAAGGTVDFAVGHGSGAITILSTSSIVANGGNSTGSPGVAGSGGVVSLLTLDQPISIAGSIIALGGNGLDTGGTGGLGGRVLAQSDAGGVAGLGGDITLESGASINVSGGTGTTGGSARSNPVVGTITLGAATIAVHFDADGDLVTTPSADSATSGRVVNNGTIIANSGGTLGAGGDVYFDGRTSAGADLTALDGGSQSRLGTLPGTDGDFLGD